MKEARYHVRHSAQWVVTLGDGTDESHARAQRAVDDLWRYTGELFIADDVDRDVAAAGLRRRSVARCADAWRAQVRRRAAAARRSTIPPSDGYMQRGGRDGQHTEHLGHMLAEMQIVARSHPGRVRGEARAAVARRAFAILDTVKDPEVPVISVVELGIVRDAVGDRRAAWS